MFRFFAEIDENNKIVSATYNNDPDAVIKTAMASGSLPSVYTHEFLLTKDELFRLRDDMHKFTWIDGVLQHDEDPSIFFTPVQVLERERIGVFIIDENGFLITRESIFIDEELEANMITEPIQEGLYRPKWNGSQWEEGATPEEIALFNENRPHVMKQKMKELESTAAQNSMTILDLFEMLIMKGGV